MERLLDGQPSRASLRSFLLTEARRPVAVRTNPRAHWYVVGTVCIGAFMGQLDASIVTLALPRLSQDLHASLGAVEWVALTYLLVLVASVATVGRIADSVGRKLLYVYGFGVFTGASALCGLAPTLAMLIVARVLQAVGAAMLQANSVALITEALPRRLLGRGIGIQGTAQALGLALGPAIGGLLLSLGGWRLIFLVNVPAGVIGFALGWFLLPRSRSRRPVHQADRLGAVQLALAVAGPLLYLSLAGRAGYANPLLVAALAAGLVAAVAFVRRERRVPDPLIDLSIFRRRTVSAGLSTGMVAYLVLFGTLVVVPYYLSAKHVGAALVGLQLAVLPVAIGVAAPIAGRLLNRIGARPLTGGGLLLTGAGLLEIALGHGTGGLVAGLALAGLGLGAFTPANNAAIMGASPKGHTGVVSGVLNMTRGIGTALGVALASAVYIAASGTGGTDSVAAAAANGLIASLAVLGALALAAGVALLVRPDTATPRCAITTNHASQGGQVMNESLDPATTHQIQRMVNDLCAEFAEEFTRAEIEEVMDDSVERIGETARFSDFLPLMAYRFTCERLKAITRARGEDVEGAWDVVFVSLSGGGRGQIAAALTAKLSGKRVSVHSAGTAARAEIDPQVRAVIEEIGLDPDEEFARPVTDEVLRGADVIVTMGHSVGVIEIPEGARHEDWRIGDPIGAPVDEIRRVRSDIEYRVRRLLTVLGAPGAEPAAAGPVG